MAMNYQLIGQRIAARRRQLQLKQSEVEERADLGYKYLSNIERGVSIPSIEVIMRLAKVLETTPDEFLVGAELLPQNERWHSVAQKLQRMDEKHLMLAEALIDVVALQNM